MAASAATLIAEKKSPIISSIFCKKSRAAQVIQNVSWQGRIVK